MNKHICIHGHFYQPPRENPWLEAVELQDSAYPYHDWNARITAECYGPNTAARILNPDGRIDGIMNNFSRISFNMGPTLLSWLEDAEPDIYESILDADRRSREIYSGHGSALAQAYNHIIMPLANTRDKRTQVLWGIRDFEARFGRPPEGMWLAETAVDLETLDIMAEHGIAFTILAPRQASRVRDPETGEWHDVSENRVDPRRPYLCNLPSGRTIALFFYDGPISQDLAFAGLLNSGETYAGRLLEAFSEENGNGELVHVATDGESYGHHHRLGEMALSYCLHYIEKNDLANITIYGEYLEHFPPDWEAEIFENSSWSCIHGVERWRENCGCCSGMHGQWHQQWRRPLREALDWLRDELIGVYEAAAAPLLANPWEARDDYIAILLDRSPENVEQFLARHAAKELSPEERIRTLMLLEIQRQAMQMYTSCGWFFDELSGIETTQVLQYAGRAIQLAEEAAGAKLEDKFLEHLKHAPSNIPEHGDGANIYCKFVKPASIGLLRVAAHYAVSTLFREFEEHDSIYCYGVEALASEQAQAGKFRLSIGKIAVRSRMTWEEKKVSFAVLHLGDQNLSGAVREYLGDEPFQQMREDITAAFRSGDVAEVVRAIDRHFEDHNYSLWHLFRDQQREILESIFGETETEVENFYRQVYRDHYHLMSAMVRTGNPLPKILKTTVEFILNRDLRRVLEYQPVDEEQFNHLQTEIRQWDVPVDRELFGYIGSRQIGALVREFAQNPLDDALLEEIEKLLKKYYGLEAVLNLWDSQNTIYQVGLQQFFLRERMAEQGQQAAVHWVERFKSVSNLLGVKLD